jgi:ABC-type multidrug transport system fused ATPase/permease subunit
METDCREVPLSSMSDLSSHPITLTEPGEPIRVTAGTTWRHIPVFELLSYARPHFKVALSTLVFGTAGFLLAFSYPWIIGSAVDLITQRDLPDRVPRLMRLTEASALTAVLHAFVVYGRGHSNVRLGDAVITDLRVRLFEHLQALSLRFYVKERTGAVLSRLLHDAHEATGLIYTGILVVFLDAVQVAIALALLAGISAKLTAACMVVLPMYGVVFATMNPRVRTASERVRSQFARMAGNVSEQLAGQALIKTHTAEQRETRKFRADGARLHEFVVAQSHESHLVAALGEVLVHLGTTVLVGYGGFLALEGEMTAGTLLRFLGYLEILYGPVRRFAELSLVYQSSLSAMRRVFEMLRIQPAVRETAHPLDVPPRAGRVRFEDVRFRYEDGTDESRARLDDGDEDVPSRRYSSPETGWVIDRVTLDVPAGQKVAIVGASGAGKTTLLCLLPRLYDVTCGRVLIDDVDVREYSLETLRASIAVVQQDAFLFTGTIRENIAYGSPEASLAEVMEAARAAHAHEFIERFPRGYETRLGERGVNLSGGQRQRISIARALLKNAPILILDEATSALDSRSESIVQEALENLMRGRTCFIISHRLSTIGSADQIVVLENGRMVEKGTHTSLLEAEGVYARLLRHQVFLTRSPSLEP